MIKLKELVRDILKELDLTPDDLKKFNRIMNGEIGVKNSIHSGKDGEEDYARKGFGYGGPSNIVYGRKAGDRPYRSDRGSVGHSQVYITPEI